MIWKLYLEKSAQKKLNHLPAKDRTQIFTALQQMQKNPFGGDIAHMKGQVVMWRRRVGSYRVFFDLYTKDARIVILDIRRRTSKTY